MNKSQEAKSMPNSIEGQVNELESIRTRIKNLKEQEERIKDSIYEKYKTKLEEKYKEKEEPFGVVNLQEESFKVIFTTPKKVEWNQDGLAKLMTQGAPIDIEYSMKETVYKDLDDESKKALLPYRTVKPGTVSVKIEYKE